MEVCGGHTHTIYRHGIEHVLPPTVELVHGPGCPVCVIPMGRVDDAIAVAQQPGVIFTTFGDMMRVPGSAGNLLEAKARGADVRCGCGPSSPPSMPSSSTPCPGSGSPTPRRASAARCSRV
jgi:hydrogenase expression/formation protein HypD